METGRTKQHRANINTVLYLDVVLLDARGFIQMSNFDNLMPRFSLIRCRRNDKIGPVDSREHAPALRASFTIDNSLKNGPVVAVKTNKIHALLVPFYLLNFFRCRDVLHRKQKQHNSPDVSAHTLRHLLHIRSVSFDSGLRVRDQKTQTTGGGTTYLDGAQKGR